MLKTAVIFSVLLSACTATDNKANPTIKSDGGNIENPKNSIDMKSEAGKNEDLSSKEKCSGDGYAEVTNVSTTGSDGNYQFNVTLKSPDEGCEQYANWWEVLDESGKLVYRRILGHSHVAEQPFTRSGGPVNVNEDKVVIVRAHMNPDGYGSKVFKGSVKDGFITFDTACDFAASTETEQPLPTNCAF